MGISSDIVGEVVPEMGILWEEFKAKPPTEQLELLQKAEKSVRERLEVD